MGGDGWGGRAQLLTSAARQAGEPPSSQSLAPVEVSLPVTYTVSQCPWGELFKMQILGPSTPEMLDFKV